MENKPQEVNAVALDDSSPIEKHPPAQTAEQAEEQTEYQHAYSPLTWWAFGAFATIVGFSRLSYGLLLPSLRADLHGSYSSYGLVGTANFVGFLVGTLVMPLILSRFHNHIKLNTISLLLMNAMMIVSAFSFNLVQLGLWRLLIGFFSALATVLTMELALAHIRQKERGQASALVWMGVSFGVLISGLIAPPIISTGSHLAWRAVWIVMGVIGAIVAIGFYRAFPSSSLQASPPKQVPTVLKKLSTGRELAATMTDLFHPRGLLFLTLAYFGLGFGYIIYLTFFVALLVQQGLPVLLVGLIWSVMGITGIVGGPIWGRLMDHWPTGWILALSLVVGAVGSLAVLTHQPSLEIVGAVLFGLSLFAGAPAIVTFLLRQAVSSERYASSFSFLTALFAIGQLIGPIVGGIVVDRQGLFTGTATSALVVGIAALFAIAYGLMQKQPRRQS